MAVAVALTCVFALSGKIQAASGRFGDIDKNGVIDQEDAVRLLLHALLPDYYPLNPPASDDDDEEVGPTVGENGTPIV